MTLQANFQIEYELEETMIDLLHFMEKLTYFLSFIFVIFNVCSLEDINVALLILNIN